jgi:hypothetical protein
LGFVGSMSGLPETGHDLQPAHELTSAAVALVASTEAASHLAVVIERVAEALLAEDEPVPQNSPGIVRAHGDASICPPEDRAL